MLLRGHCPEEIGRLKAREGRGSEVGVLGDRLVSSGDAFLKGGGLGFQPGDLGVSRVGQVIGCAQVSRMFI
jgi:hypothetical protein